MIAENGPKDFSRFGPARLIIGDSRVYLGLVRFKDCDIPLWGRRWRRVENEDIGWLTRDF